MAKKFLTSIDLSGNQLIKPVLENVASNPTNDSKKGRIAFNTELNKTIVYDGSSWKNLQYEIPAETYLTQNDTITLSGIITGTGTAKTSITTAIADGKLSIAKTDGLQDALNAKMATASYPSLTAIQALANTSGFLKKTGASTWEIDTNSYLTAESDLSAGKLTGTIPSAVLGKSSLYVGTTKIALNRPSGALSLTGITSVAIGDAVLKYDSTNNALFVEKANGEAVNFYATGEVAGFGAGSGLPEGGTGEGVSALSLLTDVSLVTPATGNVLIYNGTHWVNKPQSEIVPNLSSYASKTYVDTAVAGLVDSAPETLDTLVELAEALGNDPNFATTVANHIGTKEDKITAGTTAQYWRGNKTWATLNTDAVTEGTNNKYYTDARVKSYGDTLYLGKTATASKATALANARTFSIGGSTGLTATAVSFNGEKDVALSLTGTLKVANGGTGLTDAKGGFTRKVIGTLTTSATSYPITHSLGSDIIAQVFTSSGELVECDINSVEDEVTFGFNVAPTANSLKYVIIG